MAEDFCPICVTRKRPERSKETEKHRKGHNLVELYSSIMSLQADSFTIATIKVIYTALRFELANNNLIDEVLTDSSTYV